jgi:hypothetical protein
MNCGDKRQDTETLRARRYLQDGRLIFLAVFANPFCRTGHIPTIGTHGNGWSWKNSFDYVRGRTNASATQ